MLFNEFLINIEKKVNELFINSYLNKIKQITNNDFLLTFSKNKNIHLLISLNPKKPFINTIDYNITNNNNTVFINQIKCKLNNACLKDAKILNEDNVFLLKFVKTNDKYELETFYLICELFSNNPNLLLISNNKILFAYKLKSLDSKRPILINLSYSLPEKSEYFKLNKPLDTDFISNYSSSLNTLYLKEKYGYLINYIKSKNKHLIKKLDILNNEYNNSFEKLKFKEYGDYLKIYFNKIKKGDNYIYIEEINKNIELNPNLSPSKNLEYFYKMYKKAKTSLDIINNTIEETNNLILYLSHILDTSFLYNEEDYIDLINELQDKKILKLRLSKKIDALNKGKNKNKPYYIYYKDLRIGYGKNASQNNELSFKIANKNNYYFHLANCSSSHIVAFKDELSNDELQFIIELCLFLNNKNDGDIYVSKIKDIKKGKFLGQVFLNKYETYHQNKITNNFTDYIKNEKRFN